MAKPTDKNCSVCIAMIAPIGVDLNRIEECFRDTISSLNIKNEITNIKITDLDVFQKGKKQSGYKKYEALMTIGDKTRENEYKKTKSLQKANRVLIEKIKSSIKSEKITIIHQLKTPEECYYLRETLSKEKNIPTFLVSVFDTINNRIKFLNDKIKNNSKTLELIERDERDQLNKCGQNVSNAFPLGDFYIDASQKSTIKVQVERIVKAIYCHPHISPTISEYGMYLAEAVSLKSRDLSRQVGAAILDESGSVLALSCNEVPKAFGGCYWENDNPDNRDFIYGIDSNYKYRNELVKEFISALSEIKHLGEKAKKYLKKQSDLASLVNFINENKNLFKGTRVMNLIEFGRSVHAEVGAITEAAKNGISLKDSTLYTTVFPCHLCARYIISSGIKRIIFIEPYPKSLTLELYKSEVELSPSCSCDNKIIMQPFIGISPRIYRKVFIYNEYLMGEKKNDFAQLKPWIPNLSKWINHVS